jgi:hypothetical protein
MNVLDDKDEYLLTGKHGCLEYWWYRFTDICFYNHVGWDPTVVP